MKKRVATVQSDPVQLLCGCNQPKMRCRQYLHCPYLVASGEGLCNTIDRINAIMYEVSTNCLRPEIPYPTLHGNNEGGDTQLMCYKEQCLFLSYQWRK